MIWRDRIQGTGSLNGVLFYVLDSTFTPGRRQVEHEYPLRDIPHNEDLGRDARKFTLNVYVLGDQYDRARDALIAELEKPDPHILQHSCYGRMKVSMESATVRESTREGGRAEFELAFIESGEPLYPGQQPDTAQALATGCSVAAAASTDAKCCTWVAVHRAARTWAVSSFVFFAGQWILCVQQTADSRQQTATDVMIIQC